MTSRLPRHRPGEPFANIVPVEFPQRTVNAALPKGLGPTMDQPCPRLGPDDHPEPERGTSPKRANGPMCRAVAREGGPQKADRARLCSHAQQPDYLWAGKVGIGSVTTTATFRWTFTDFTDFTDLKNYPERLDRCAPCWALCEQPQFPGEEVVGKVGEVGKPPRFLGLRAGGGR